MDWNSSEKPWFFGVTRQLMSCLDFLMLSGGLRRLPAAVLVINNGGTGAFATAPVTYPLPGAFRCGRAKCILSRTYGPAGYLAGLIGYWSLNF